MKRGIRSRQIVWLAGNADVLRNVVAGPEFVADDAAHAGVGECRAGAIAGEHVVGAALMGGFTVGHAAADGDLVHDLCSLHPAFVDEHARHAGFDGRHRPAVLDRSIRLGVEAFLMGHAARQEDEDHRLGSTFFAFVVLNIRLG